MTSNLAVSQVDPASRPGLAAVDTSFRAVTIFLLAKSSFWLVLGTFLLLFASVKLHAPGMMSDAAWLSYGRLFPAGWNVLVYGFIGQAGFLVGLWLLARASWQRLQAPWLVLAGGVCWNFGVLVAVIGILAGHSTGREWLEMPLGALGLLVVGAGLIGVSGWITYAARTEGDTYPSAWFVLLALLSFVWFGTAALMMFGGEGSRGVIQVLVQRWFANGMMRLWLGGLGLAILFHFLPRLLGRPLASRQLALIAFWTLTFFAPWAVTAHGDPLPRWIISAGIAGQTFSVVALLAVGLNWWKTAEGGLGNLFSSWQGRLIGTAAFSYLAAWGLQFGVSLKVPASVLRLTWIHQGLDWLFLGGAMMAAIFAVLPDLVERATGRAMPSRLFTTHAAMTLAGVLLTAIPLILAGLVQGARLADVSLAFDDASRGSMNLVRLSSLGLLILFLGQLVFVASVASVLRSLVVERVAQVRSWTVRIPNGRTAEVRS